MASFGPPPRPRATVEEGLLRSLQDEHSHLSIGRREKAYKRAVAARHGQRAWAVAQSGMEAYVALTLAQSKKSSKKSAQRRETRSSSSPLSTNGEGTVTCEADLVQLVENMGRARQDLKRAVQAQTRGERLPVAARSAADLEADLAAMYRSSFTALYPVKRAHRERAARLEERARSSRVPRPRSAIVGKPRPTSAWLQDLRARQAAALPKVLPT